MPKHFLCWPLLLGVACLFSPILDSHSVSRAATLAEFFSAADQTSPRLLEAHLEVARIRALHSEQRALPNPTLFGSNEELGNDDASVQERTFGVRQELGFLWTMRAQKSSSSAAIAAAEAKYHSERSAAYSELLTQLLRVQHVYQSLQLSDSLEQHYSGILTANEAREREGDISGYDAQRVRFESIAVSNRRAQLHAAWNELIAELKKNTGLDESQLLSVDVKSLFGLTFSSEDEAVTYAKFHALELSFLQANEKAAQQELAAQKLRRLPNFAVGVGHKSTDHDESGLLIEAELELPLFSRRNPAVQLARAERNNARQLNANAQSQWSDLVGDAYARWQSLERQTKSAPALEELVAHVNAAQSLYLNGETGYLELLDAFKSSEEILSAAQELALAHMQADLRLRQLTGYPILEDK
ncbi:MAG: TolC family protein [Calditrichaeota bacterium]|nr:TolC family protein [Calditrichota bacterium]MCB9369903.1 TolC family protein [Calditrichota bacterium]